MTFLHRKKRHCRFLPTCIVLLSVASVLLGSSPSADAAMLSGTVVGPDETPVAGLVVAAEDQRTITDEDGKFELRGLDVGEALLRLLGDAGEGRVRVEVDADGVSVPLVYPVMTTVALLHDNDVHFNFTCRDAFEEAVDDVRNRYDNVFLLSAGDMFVRHADRWARPNDVAYYQEMCAYIIDAMNEIGFDACTLGNHELFYIEGYTREALDRARFPLLGANIVLETDNVPPLKPYIVFETYNELSLAVLGLTRASSGRDDVKSLDSIETAREYLHLARDHDLLVALTHLGLNQDRRLAEAVPEIDVIIGGHSNHLLEEGELVNGVLVTMAGGPPSGHRHQVNPEWSKYLGKILLTFENERLVEKKARVMTFTPALAATSP